MRYKNTANCTNYFFYRSRVHIPQILLGEGKVSLEAVGGSQWHSHLCGCHWQPGGFWKVKPGRSPNLHNGCAKWTFHLIYHLICSSSLPRCLTYICFSSPAQIARCKSLAINVERLLALLVFAAFSHSLTHSFKLPFFNLPTSSPLSLSLFFLALSIFFLQAEIQQWRCGTFPQQRSTRTSGVTLVGSPVCLHLPLSTARGWVRTHTHTHTHTCPHLYTWDVYSWVMPVSCSVVIIGAVHQIKPSER